MSCGPEETRVLISQKNWEELVKNCGDIALEKKGRFLIVDTSETIPSGKVDWNQYKQKFEPISQTPLGKEV